MRKSRFTEEQIIGVLREQEAGAEKRRSTEPRNAVTIGVTATADSTSDWREEGAQVKRGRDVPRLRLGAVDPLAPGHVAAMQVLVLARRAQVTG